MRTNNRDENVKIAKEAKTLELQINWCKNEQVRFNEILP